MLSSLFFLIYSRHRHFIYHRVKWECMFYVNHSAMAKLTSGSLTNIADRILVSSISPWWSRTLLENEWLQRDSENEVIRRRSVIFWVSMITLNSQLWVAFLHFSQQLLDLSIRFIYLQPRRWNAGERTFSYCFEELHSKCPGAWQSSWFRNLRSKGHLYCLLYAAK